MRTTQVFIDNNGQNLSTHNTTLVETFRLATHQGKFTDSSFSLKTKERLINIDECGRLAIVTSEFSTHIDEDLITDVRITYYEDEDDVKMDIFTDRAKTHIVLWLKE